MTNTNPNKQPTVRVRVRFAKTGVMRFVGHLDIMRFFQKAVRRARLPIAYTGGFHPHQIMSFALPLGIGTTSEGEYMDIELTERIDPQDALCRLNEQMADGVEVLAFRYLPQKSKKAMAAVEAARYVVSLQALGEEAVIALACQDAKDSAQTDHDRDSLTELSFEMLLQEGIRVFYEEADQIIITKKTKKSERQLDLKPLIYEFRIPDAHEEAALAQVMADRASQSQAACSHPCLLLTLSAGSTDNIKPELVMSHFMKSLGVREDGYRLGIHRLDLLGKDGNGQLVSLGDAGE